MKFTNLQADLVRVEQLEPEGSATLVIIIIIIVVIIIGAVVFFMMSKKGKGGEEADPAPAAVSHDTGNDGVVEMKQEAAPANTESGADTGRPL